MLRVSILYVILTIGCFDIIEVNGMLYPKPSEIRDLRYLDGIWDFRQDDDQNLGLEHEWFKQDLKDTGEVIPMPVPASYNDITQDRYLRDYVGVVWYQRTFYVPPTWNHSDMRIWLRFGSVHYHAKVYINGELAMEHELGHLPFQAEVTDFVKFGILNRITVYCDNTLSSKTVPQGQRGTIHVGNKTLHTLDIRFDFFNYAGIHRPVVLYSTPKIYIEDLNVKTTIDENNSAYIDYEIKANGTVNNNTQCNVSLFFANNTKVDINLINASNDSCKGQMVVQNPILWWPYLMDPSPAYLYTLEAMLTVEDTIVDVYRQPVGIRMLTWDNTSFLINNKPVYLRGFGRHEDSDIRGKGLDLALVAKDYNLIKWIGANSFRTSHYPYAEEIMDFADREGIMIIDECPAVNVGDYGYGDDMLQTHKRSLSELYQRDKNRPSVIAWSIANEPPSGAVAADSYFETIANHVKELDRTRPITLAISTSLNDDRSGKYLDIVSFNRYNGWYKNPARLDNVMTEVISEATGWYKKYNKPVIMSEYGADTLGGLHVHPEVMWSEEFQVEEMAEHFKAFDKLRESGFFIGEFIWNFADFQTKQDRTRVGGNKKGIFTRNRQPKTAAFLMRERYLQLAQALDNATIPQDYKKYSFCSHC